MFSNSSLQAQRMCMSFHKLSNSFQQASFPFEMEAVCLFWQNKIEFMNVLNTNIQNFSNTVVILWLYAYIYKILKKSVLKDLGFAKLHTNFYPLFTIFSCYFLCTIVRKCNRNKAVTVLNLIYSIYNGPQTFLP